MLKFKFLPAFALFATFATFNSYFTNYNYNQFHDHGFSPVMNGFGNYNNHNHFNNYMPIYQRPVQNMWSNGNWGYNNVQSSPVMTNDNFFNNLFSSNRSTPQIIRQPSVKYGFSGDLSRSTKKPLSLTNGYGNSKYLSKAITKSELDKLLNPSSTSTLNYNYNTFSSPQKYKKTKVKSNTKNYNTYNTYTTTPKTKNYNTYTTTTPKTYDNGNFNMTNSFNNWWNPKIYNNSSNNRVVFDSKSISKSPTVKTIKKKPRTTSLRLNSNLFQNRNDLQKTLNYATKPGKTQRYVAKSRIQTIPNTRMVRKQSFPIPIKRSTIKRPTVLTIPNTRMVRKQSLPIPIKRSTIKRPSVHTI